MSAVAERRAPAWFRPVRDAAPAAVFLIVLLVTGDFRKAAWALLGLSITALVIEIGRAHV